LRAFPDPTPTDEALSFGWITGVRRRSADGHVREAASGGLERLKKFLGRIFKATGLERE
jgi:hypothetical protein